MSEITQMTVHEAERLTALWCSGQPLDDIPQWRTAMQVLYRELSNTRAIPMELNWKIVPVPWTRVMRQAFINASAGAVTGAETAGWEAAIAAAPEPPHISMTSEDARTFQNWAGMDGAAAFHLIERHADGWGDVGRMMNAWLAANKETPNFGPLHAVVGRSLGLASMEGLGPLPLLVHCPLCGAGNGYTLTDGSTYRWWIVSCAGCGHDLGECHADRTLKHGTDKPGRWKWADEHWNEVGAHAQGLRDALETMRGW